MEMDGSSRHCHRETGVFPALSTKLSTGDVDNRRNPLVYWYLAQMVRIYINCMLRRMIFDTVTNIVSAAPNGRVMHKSHGTRRSRCFSGPIFQVLDFIHLNFFDF